MGCCSSKPTKNANVAVPNVKSDGSYRPRKLQEVECPFIVPKTQFIVGDKRLLMFETAKM